MDISWAPEMSIYMFLLPLQISSDLTMSKCRHVQWFIAGFTAVRSFDEPWRRGGVFCVIRVNVFIMSPSLWENEFVNPCWFGHLPCFWWIKQRLWTSFFESENLKDIIKYMANIFMICRLVQVLYGSLVQWRVEQGGVQGHMLSVCTVFTLGKNKSYNFRKCLVWFSLWTLRILGMSFLVSKTPCFHRRVWCFHRRGQDSYGDVIFKISEQKRGWQNRFPTPKKSFWHVATKQSISCNSKPPVLNGWNWLNNKFPCKDLESSNWNTTHW